MGVGVGVESKARLGTCAGHGIGPGAVGTCRLTL